MATYWTLTYAGTEKALADWGITADILAEFCNKEKDVLTLRTIEQFDPAAAQFAWGNKLVARRDRTLSAGVYSGGTIFFQGYVADTVTSADGSSQAMGYKVFSVWWLLERLIFKQTRNIWNGYTTPGVPSSGNTFKAVVLEETFLGEDPSEAYWTGTQTITEIVNFVNECWNATKQGATSGRDNSQDVLQIGGIDCGQQFPKTRASTVSCAESIVQVLRYFPATQVWLDHTTTPPTLWIKDIANLASVSETLSANQEKQVRIAPQYARQLTGVRLTYKQVATIDGQCWPQTYQDIYPATGTNDWTPTALHQAVEIAGSKTTHVRGAVTVIPLAPAYSSTAATRAAFWNAIDSTLQDPLIKSATVAAAVPSSVVDNAGAPVDLTNFPNILAPGCQVYSWMGVNWVEATISVTTTYSRYRDAGTFLLIDSTVTRVLTHRVILTNAVSKTYEAVSAFDEGDTLPPIYPAAGSLAQAMYQSLSRLQYEGTVTFIGGVPRNDIAVGMVLTLVGPNHTYAGLLVQGVSVSPHYGTVAVKFGPASRLDAAGMIEMWLLPRRRQIVQMKSGRSSGTAPSLASVDQTGAAHKENSTHSLPAYAAFGVTGS